jgi:hypothetical protein
MTSAIANQSVGGQIMYSGWNNADWVFPAADKYPRLRRAYTLTMANVPGGAFTRSGNRIDVASFRMGVVELPKEACNAVMPEASNQNVATWSHIPAQSISWYGALAVCNRLRLSEGLTPVYRINGSTSPDSWGAVPTGNNGSWNAAVCDWNADGYRLPREDEWYWAAMGASDSTQKTFPVEIGSTGIGWLGGNQASYAWYSVNNNGTVRHAASRFPNEYGYYDMVGNVWEICWETTTGNNHAYRGGSYPHPTHYSSINGRYSGAPYAIYTDVGFRVFRNQ